MSIVVSNLKKNKASSVVTNNLQRRPQVYYPNPGTEKDNTVVNYMGGLPITPIKTAIRMDKQRRKAERFERIYRSPARNISQTVDRNGAVPSVKSPSVKSPSVKSPSVMSTTGTPSVMNWVPPNTRSDVIYYYIPDSKENTYFQKTTTTYGYQKNDNIWYDRFHKEITRYPMKRIESDDKLVDIINFIVMNPNIEYDPSIEFPYLPNVTAPLHSDIFHLIKLHFDEYKAVERIQLIPIVDQEGYKHYLYTRNNPDGGNEYFIGPLY